ncbi:NrdH-redoxin, partial [Candidatus Saccharibacteria bacterium]|nr:NrdH-redoxin [Candidatus Saccharibacteria bacterium]
MIKVITSPTCGYCHALIDWLEQKNLEYVELDASNFPGISAVPITIITDE